MIQLGQKRFGLQPPRDLRFRLREETGSTLVETALSITILLVLVIGIMDACLMVYSYHFISNAAREGTRYAIVRGNTWTQPPWNYTGTCASYTSAGCVATQQNIEDYVKSLSFPGIDSSQITVTPTSYAANGSATSCEAATSTPPPSSAPLCNARGNLIQVNVQYRFATFIPFVPSQWLTMSSTSRMLITQ
jgi:Flp pilus assembly protein TadG